MATINSSDILVTSWINKSSNNFNGKEVIKYYIHDSEGWEYNLNSSPNSWSYTFEHYTGEENYIDYVFNSIDPYISLDFVRTYSASEGDIDIYMLGNWSAPSSLGFTDIKNNKTEVFWYATNQYNQIGYLPLKDNDAYTLVHEIGHALGLSHPQLNGADDPYGNWHDSNDTVMSYNYISSTTAPIWKTIDIQALIDIWGPEGGDTTAPAITGPSGSAGANTSLTTINENTTTVHTFTANETVTWSINGGLDPSFFTINSSTGLLTFKNAPDYEKPLDSNTNGMYSIYVKATDNAGNSSNQFVQVNIADVAEDFIAPTITVPTSTNTATFLLFEGIPTLHIYENQTSIYTYTADEEVTWSLKESNYSATDYTKFTINNSSGDLTFNTAPDYENPVDSLQNNIYALTIKATDTSGNNSSQELWVTIWDVENETLNSATATELQQLYIGYFGRPCDPAGLDYWLDQGVTKKAFAANMYLQPEFNSVNGNLSTVAQVNQIYLNLFNREGDTAGLTYWASQIDSGILELASIANDLTWAALNNVGSEIDRKTLNHKTNAAILYTYEIRNSTAALLEYTAKSTSPWITGNNLTEAKTFIKEVGYSKVATLSEIQASIAKFSSTPKSLKLIDSDNPNYSIDKVTGLSLDNFFNESTEDLRQPEIAFDNNFSVLDQQIEYNKLNYVELSDHRTNKKYLSNLYEEVLDKNSDIEVLNYCLGQLETVVESRFEVSLGYSSSIENQLIPSNTLLA